MQQQTPPPSSRKQLPFTSMKPPFGGGGGGGGGDYHNFATGDAKRPDQEFDEAVVVKKRTVSGLSSSEFFFSQLRIGFCRAYFVYLSVLMASSKWAWRFSLYGVTFLDLLRLSCGF